MAVGGGVRYIMARESGRTSAKVWFHRIRAVLWAIGGALAFPLGYANSVALVWFASVYANVFTDWGAAEAANDKAVQDHISRLEQKVDNLTAMVLELRRKLGVGESGMGSEAGRRGRHAGITGDDVAK